MSQKDHDILIRISENVITIEEKLEKHLEHSEETLKTYIPMVIKHTEILEHIVKELPSKGFCTETEANLKRINDELHPQGDTSLHEKVQTLWYDRKILKWILAAVIGTLITAIGTLVIGFIKGVF